MLMRSYPAVGAVTDRAGFVTEEFFPRLNLFGNTGDSRTTASESDVPAMSTAIQYLQPGRQLHRLPLATLYLTERCNSRCVTCDYWRTGRADMTLDAVTGLLPSLLRLQTQVVLISGGEPLINPQWPAIAQLLTDNGMRLWLLTSGLSLVKHARSAARVFDAITVSMDGTDSATYAAIRGLDAFDNVCAGVEACADEGVPARLRVTLQRSNYRQLPRFIDLARRLRARQVSFLAVDVANPHAFGRNDDFASNLALRREDLGELEQILSSVERDYAADFSSGFIAESPGKLRRIHQYFQAVCSDAPYPPVRCNAPEVSAVIDAKGRVSPCFFISGPANTGWREDLGEALNADSMADLRADIRAGNRPECKRCVCSLWRDPQAAAIVDL